MEHRPQTFFRKNPNIFFKQAFFFVCIYEDIKKDRTPMKNKHIHDCGYKNFFSNPVTVKQLLTSFVKEDWIHNLDFDTLERMETSFVTDEFKEKESDLIYKVQVQGNEVYIYILLEFQSTVDRFMALRMLRYITEFYEHLVKSQKVKKLPSVFPLLLYNGDKKWTAPVDIDTLIDDNIPVEYIPSFKYYKIAENDFSKETLKQIENVVSALFYVENSIPEKLLKEIDIVSEMIKNERPYETHVFLNWMRVTFNEKHEDIYHEIKQVEEIRTMFATKLEKYGEKLKKEGLQEGLQKGVQEGMHRKAIQTAKALLDK